MQMRILSKQGGKICFGKLLCTASARLFLFYGVASFILSWNNAHSMVLNDLLELFLPSHLVLLHLLLQILDVAINHALADLLNFHLLLPYNSFILKSALFLLFPGFVVIRTQVFLALFFLFQLFPDILFDRISSFGVKIPFLLMLFEKRQLIPNAILLHFPHLFVFVVIHLLQQTHLVLFFHDGPFLFCGVAINDKIRGGISLLLLLSLPPLFGCCDLTLKLSLKLYPFGLLYSRFLLLLVPEIVLIFT